MPENQSHFHLVLLSYHFIGHFIISFLFCWPMKIIFGIWYSIRDKKKVFSLYYNVIIPKFMKYLPWNIHIKSTEEEMNSMCVRARNFKMFMNFREYGRKTSIINGTFKRELLMFVSRKWKMSQRNTFIKTLICKTEIKTLSMNRRNLDQWRKF